MKQRKKNILTFGTLARHFLAFVSLSKASAYVRPGRPVSSQVHTIALHNTNLSQYSLQKIINHYVTIHAVFTQSTIQNNTTYLHYQKYTRKENKK